jgi:hypothetical protein
MFKESYNYKNVIHLFLLICVCLLGYIIPILPFVLYLLLKLKYGKLKNNLVLILAITQFHQIIMLLSTYLVFNILKLTTIIYILFVLFVLFSPSLIIYLYFKSRTISNYYLIRDITIIIFVFNIFLFLTITPSIEFS